MFEQVTIWVPSLQLITDIVTAYFLIGFWPWLAFCVTGTWSDYGRSSREMRLIGFLGITLTWSLWPLLIGEIKKNIGGFNRDFRCYQ